MDNIYNIAKLIKFLIYILKNNKKNENNFQQ